MNIFTKIKDKLFSILNSFNKDNIENVMDSLAINNYSVNKGSYILYWSIASFTIIFIIWSFFASVDQVVRATGEVVPTSKVHVIQSPNLGIVEAIKTKMSDQVEKGEILFLINNKVAEDKYKLAKAVRDAQKRKVELIEELVKRGSEAEIRLIDERLTLYNTEDQLQKAETDMKHSKIVSPVKGTISGVDVVNIDQVVAAGEQIATIVPYNDILQIEALVQMSALSLLSLPGNKGKIVYLTSATNLKFIKKILPNSKLYIETKINSFKRGMASCHGLGFINDEIVCKADFNLILPDEIKKYSLNKN